MRTGYGQVLLVLLGVVVVFGPAICVAAEPGGDENIWLDEQPRRERRQLNEEAIERMMQRIREVDPQHADELAQLRTEDPDAFRVALWGAIREHMEQQTGGRPERMRGRREQGMGFEQGGRRGEPGQGPMARHAGDGRGREMIRERMRDRHGEYIEWLGENYPEEAEKLEQLRQEKGELYMRKLMVSMKKYGRIFRESKDNPELAAVLKDDMILKERRRELLREIRTTADEDKKQALIGKLEDVLSQRFDLIVRRKQITYEELAKKLAELQKEVKEKEAEVGKWKDAAFKRENVKGRVEKLLGKNEKFEWE